MYFVEDKNKKTKTRPDFVLGKKKYQAELIPPALIVRRWFADEHAAIYAHLAANPTRLATAEELNEFMPPNPWAAKETM